MNVRISRAAISSPTTLNLSNVSCWSTSPETPSITRIKNAVAQAFGMSLATLESRQRPEHVAWPRMIAMHCAAMLTGASFREIGAAFARNHSTVVHACRTVKERMELEAKARRQVSEILKRIEQ